ncbi:protein kinase family protein [Orrella marina]|uniref:Uncharacterized protein n=1 Tax=Orrella marina TaxID=2163011 RepID=A0A2R4XFN8_9BURK|nr:hypothetical protein [Orrella marina]AWB32618.1 hypothetical protein DBV39_01570 [Orrella marina]
MSDVPIPDQKQNQTPVVLAKGTCAIKGWSDAVNTTWFDPQRYELHAHPVADGGRGSAWYVDVAGQPGVLRQYRRGG